MTDGKHPHPPHPDYALGAGSRFAQAAEQDGHILVLGNDARARFAVAAQLREAGYRVREAATFGAVELLLSSGDAFDLLVTMQSLGEMAQFGLPQLARSVCPELPILVLELEAVCGQGLIEAARATITRWPLRNPHAIPLH